jgi:hypothetical protein
MTTDQIADAAEALTGDRPAVYRADSGHQGTGPKFPRLYSPTPILTGGQLELLKRLSTGPVNYAAMCSTEGLYALLRNDLAEIDRRTDAVTITEAGRVYLFAGP